MSNETRRLVVSVQDLCQIISPRYVLHLALESKGKTLLQLWIDTALPIKQKITSGIVPASLSPSLVDS